MTRREAVLKTAIDLKDLARLDRQLRRDQEAPLRQLQERDRAIGARVQGQAPRRRLRAWLDATAAGDELRRYSGIEVSVGFWLALLGLLSGLFAMSGFLMVDQRQPVNVLLFIALFVGLQWLLLLLTLLVALALAWQGQLHLPLENLNPARWLFRRQLRRLSAGLRREQFVPVIRLALLTWGQIFGVFFNLGAMAAMLLILLVVDRSFGWSSTLDISPEGLHRAFQWLAAPWAWLWPDATVSAELIVASRYQSLQSEFAAPQVAAMRGWWPFLFACITVYGLLPRLLLWLLFYCRYRRQLLATFLNYPGARLPLQRMSAPLVHTQASGHEGPQDSGDGFVSRRALPADRPRLVVDWSGALNADRKGLSTALGVSSQGVERGGLDLSEDAGLLKKANELRRDVVILVKSWEPPLAELGDFLRGISAKLDCYLVLIPMPERDIRQEELADWQQFARQNHHPRLVIVAAEDDHPTEAPPS